MVKASSLLLISLGFASAYNEDLTCGNCIDGNYIYCYKGKTPQTANSQDFPTYNDFHHKCCKDASSCPEYLNHDSGYICLYNYQSTGTGAATMPKSGCPYVTSACGSYRDLTEQQETVGDVALEAKGVPAGEVCAYKLDPTKTKPVIELLGDDNAAVEVMEVKQEVARDPDALNAALSGSVNFLKGANQESEWDNFYNQENAAFDVLDRNHNGVSVDVSDEKRFKAIINLKQVPINQCLNSKINSDHSFNYNTEKSRMPYNNPEFNAALMAWNTARQASSSKGGSFLTTEEAAANLAAFQNIPELVTPGPAKIRETYSTNTLKVGENESVGGSNAEDSDAGTPLQCEDEEGGCRVYLVFNPKVDGIELAMNVHPTIDPTSGENASFASGLQMAAVPVALAMAAYL